MNYKIEGALKKSRVTSNNIDMSNMPGEHENNLLYDN